MLDFNSLLELVDLDPSDILLVRHFPVEKELRRVLPWLVEERPELWLAYQQIQWVTLERAMTRGSHIASFIGLDPNRATFAGIYRIGGSVTLDYEGYRSFPGNAACRVVVKGIILGRGIPGLYDFPVSAIKGLGIVDLEPFDLHEIAVRGHGPLLELSLEVRRSHRSPFLLERRERKPRRVQRMPLRRW